MARKADTPCSICGRLLWVGRGSLPSPTCRPCRRRRRAEKIEAYAAAKAAQRA